MAEVSVLAGGDERGRGLSRICQKVMRGVEHADDQRVISGIPCVCQQVRLPLVRLPGKLMVRRRRSTPTASVRTGRGDGIWENLFRELAGNGRSTEPANGRLTRVKAHRSASGGKGNEAGCCRSRGGRNTKIHALADAKGRLVAIL